MGFIRSTKGSIISDYFKLVGDVAFLKDGELVDVALYEDYLGVTIKRSEDEVKLSYDKITDVFFGKTKELVTVDKSPIGRAVVGGLLFGGVGAIVGASSGQGKTKSIDLNTYLIISYTSDEEEKYLQFIDTRKYKGKLLAKKLRELCNISDEPKGPETIEL